AVVRELVARTMAFVDAERNALLDHLEIAGAAPLTDRAVVEVVVGPLARQLRTPDGRRYLRLCAQLITHPRFVNDPREALLMSRSAQRCAQHLAGALAHLPTAISVERASQVIGFLIRACGDQARLLDAPEPSRAPLGIEAFSANLVDTMLAILHAPTTARLDGQE
ncbi:MAG TPA: hypothetical protein VFO60_09430, partial [Candidatus Dormibacteraeota bacterium]|nr:hypothetical protein [Candidatus Dormibacteraeota bacterium]